MEPEICTKMLKKLSEKLRASRWRFLESFLTASKPREGQSLQQKEKKGEKGKVKKIPKIEKPKDVGHFLVQNKNFDFCARASQNVVKRDASDKKGKLSCCKCIFDQINANLAEIQPENHQNVHKTHFLQNLQESMG